jgi:metallo-beta-lactamase family protein
MLVKDRANAKQGEHLVATTLKFCGAAGMVTGSCYWLRTNKVNFLVDCGMFQGTKTVKELNYGSFPFDPKKLDFVLLTHAHIDHSGLLPKLFKQGFTGPAYMTRGSRDLLSYMLPDSGYIQEREVSFLNRRNIRRGRPEVTPIYSKMDAEKCQSHFRTIEYENWVTMPGDIRVKYWNAGHILGSASIEIEIPRKERNSSSLRMLFSGDIGPDHKLFHPDPDASTDYDYVICESTYGGRQRVHATPGKRRQLLAREVKDALKSNGILLIPSFAVERTQELLADLIILQQQGVISNIPIFIDSPLAIKATRVFERHANELEDIGEELSLTNTTNIRFTETADESKAINRFKNGIIIMAASGMCEAGRIRHHLKNHLWRRKASVLIVGYQAKGTLGRLLVDGVKKVKIQGEDIDINATIRKIDTYSGHADESELVDWILQRKPIRQKLFLTHGEKQAAEALRTVLINKGLSPDLLAIPSLDDEVHLTNHGKAGKFADVPHRIPTEALSGLDWHNDLAQLQLDLKEAFEKSADRRTRQALLRKIRTALGQK